ncbi:MAG: phosphoglycerate kinase, partial [bacterium]
VTSLLRVLEEKPKSVVVVMGGAKISTKLKVLERFLKRGSTVLLGGALANNFFKALGLEVGESLWSKDEVALARKFMRASRLYLPPDVIVAKEKKENARVRMIPPTAVKEDEIILDVGLTALCEYQAILNKAKTIIWNGPLGLTEIPTFAHGSLMLGRTIAKRAEFGAFTVVGGGDTLPIVEMTGMSHTFSFVSTGGGAMLEFLSGQMLPGIIPLVNKNE